MPSLYCQNPVSWLPLAHRLMPGNPIGSAIYTDGMSIAYVYATLKIYREVK